jgi:hypothetical protein
MPLKSNVRPRFKLHDEITCAIHCTSRAFVRGAGCGRRLEVGASGQGRQPRSARAARPSAASARLHHLARECAAPVQAPARPPIEEPKLQVSFIAARPGEPRLSRVINPQVQFERQSGSLRFQRWYASPSKYKARLRLHERGLTLPSSGPAFGTPLKSNVRHLM